VGGGIPINAIEIIDAVRRHGGSFVVNDGKLLLRGNGPRLPEELLQAIREHTPSIMIALGVPMDRVVASTLRELRPNLPAALRALPDEKLHALVDWSIIAAWERTVQKMIDGNGAPRGGRKR